jgi:EamA domain-containing membrane protein RarD
MTYLLRLLLIILSATTIIIADSLIKKISAGQSFFNIIKNPWMILVYALYLIGIFIAIFIFISKGELAIYANLFIIFYGIFGVVIGMIFFKETISTIQIAGIGFGLIGAILMNLK